MTTCELALPVSLKIGYYCYSFRGNKNDVNSLFYFPQILFRTFAARQSYIDGRTPPPVPRHLRFATARSLMVYCSSDSLPGSVHAKDTKEQIINRLHDVTDLTLSGKKNIRKSEVTRAEICFPFSWSELFGSDLRLLYSTQNQRCLDLS